MIRRKAALGDVILLTGLVREIYKRYMGMAIIDIATDFPQVFQNNPYVNQVVLVTKPLKSLVRPFPIFASKRRIYKVMYENDQSRNYDLTINLDGAYEWNINNSIVDSYFYRTFGAIDFDKRAEIFHSEIDLARHKKTSIYNQKYIVIHMRNWYLQHKNIDIEVWKSFLNKFLSAYLDFYVVVIGSNNDFYLPNNPRILDYRNLGSLGLEKLIINQAKLFIGSNTGSLHLAGATNVPILALMSDMFDYQIQPARNHLPAGHFRAIYPDLSCVGCWNRQEIPVKHVACERNDFACNQLLTPQLIFSAAVDMLSA